MTYDPEQDWEAPTLLGEFWYRCPICGMARPESQTTRDVLTVSQQGLRVCVYCFDQPGVEDFQPDADRRIRDAGYRESIPKPV